MMARASAGKGHVAEEALRSYFTSLGYFAVRSVPFNYKSFDVTDVDLWLYMKSSSLARERTCVDIKRKKTPQAMERVFWTKGLREVLGVDRAVVVTTDNRKETRDLGAEHGVTVFHGDFLQRVINGYPSAPTRITEEDLHGLLKAPCIVDSSIVWSRWYRNAKATLLDGLTFNGCNKLLICIRLLLEEYFATNKTSALPVRLLYLLVAYFLISLDHASRLIVHLDADQRKRSLADGIRYGEAGRERTEEIVDMALHLLAESGKAGLFSQSQLKDEFEKQVSDYPAEILAEHFSKAESLKNLFALARDFEKQAYASELVMPHQCPSEQKGALGLFCDFLRIDRRQVI